MKEMKELRIMKELIALMEMKIYERNESPDKNENYERIDSLDRNEIYERNEILGRNEKKSILSFFPNMLSF